MPKRPTRFLARAPLRIDFAGGYTDVSRFAEREGGAVTNVAVTRFAEAELTLDGAGLRLASEDLRDELVLRGATDLVYDGRLDLLKAALNVQPVTGPLRLATRVDVPPGAGLGTSGALDVALAAVLGAARNERHDPTDLAELGYVAEAEELKVLGGKQDQYAAALGGAHLFRFREEVEPDAIPLDEAACEALERHIVVAYTGESRLSGEMHARVWRAYEEGDSGVTAGLRALRDCAARAAAALRANDWRALGEVVGENWAREKELARDIETPRLAELIAVGVDLGTWGAKALGAGGGGYLLFVSPRVDELAEALAARGAALIGLRVARNGVRVTASDA